MMLTLASVHIVDFPEYKERLNSLVQRVRAVYPKRNRIVHGLWQPMDSQRVFRQSYRARGELTPFYDIIALADLMDTVAEIIQLSADIRTFVTDLTELFVALMPRRL
jgi:hypothetical protein